MSDEELKEKDTFMETLSKTNEDEVSSSKAKAVLNLTLIISFVSLLSIVPAFLFTIQGNYAGAFIALFLAIAYSYFSAGKVLVNGLAGFVTYQIGVILSFALLVLVQNYALEAMPKIMRNIQYVWLTANLATALFSLPWRAKLNAKIDKFMEENG